MGISDKPSRKSRMLQSKYDGERRNPKDKFAWQEHETHVANTFDGKKTFGTGNKPMYKGDVKSDKFLFEAKSTAKSSISIKHAWLDKISKEAFAYDREPVLHVRFVSPPDNDICTTDWVMIPERLFKKILEDYAG